MTSIENPILEEIIASLPDISSKVEEFREIILANLAMLGEIPSPTFHEEQRIAFLLNRFTELGLNASADEVGNGIAIIEGKKGNKNIAITAHADTNVHENVNHTFTILPDKVNGPGVADNSLGVAVLASLPYLLEKLDIQFNANLILISDTRSLGRGNLEGIKHYLNNSKHTIHHGICIEGIKAGRLSHKSIGMLRGKISCEIPEQYDWSRFGSSSAILTLNEVINKINDIRLPKRPKSSIVMGSIEGGNSYNTIATSARLKFEIRSESEELTQEIGERIEEIVSEVSSGPKETVSLDIVAKRGPGGISFSHPLVKSSLKIIDSLGVKPRLAPSTSELAAFIEKEIPALTIGITSGDRIDETKESIDIEPVSRGIAQIIGILKAIDGGCCE